jgi:hypothetical protein
MTKLDHITYLLDELKIPVNDPYCPEDWKDWYHYIFFDPVTQTRLLFNISLSGRPGNGTITVTVFLTVPSGFLHSAISSFDAFETFGFCDTILWSDQVERVPLMINTDHTFFSIDKNKVSIRCNHPASAIRFSVDGFPAATPVYVPELFPFGKGFIGWGLIPGMDMNGKVFLHDKPITISTKWYCYHDHNYGRFNWGEDLGWTWFVISVFDSKGIKTSYVLHQGNNRDLTKTGIPFLFVYEKDMLKKIFMGESVELNWQWNNEPEKPPILPGVMASLFADRHVAVPSGFTVKATDDKDYLYIKMKRESVTEMILPDYDKKQYTFMKEMNGVVEAVQFIQAKKKLFAKGFCYAEFVH